MKTKFQHYLNVARNVTGSKTCLISVLIVLWVFTTPTIYIRASGLNFSVFDASTEMDSGGGAVWKLILGHVAEKESWSINYIDGTLPHGLELLFNGKVDLLTTLPHKDSGMYPGIIAQEAVISSWAQIYTHSDISVQSFMDLEHKSIGVVQDNFNNSGSRKVLMELGIDLKLVEFKSGVELLKALENKWIDAAVVDRFFGALKIRDYKIVKTSIIFSPLDYRSAVSSSSNKNILNILDYHLRALKKDPDSIYNIHMENIFGENQNLRLMKYLKYGLLFAMICFFGVSVHALILRHRVKDRTSKLMQKNLELGEVLTKREKAEHAKHDSEYQFYSLFHASPEGIAVHEIICDTSGNGIDYVIKDINPAYTRHTGLNRDQVVGKQAIEIYGTEFPPDLEKFADTALNGTSHQFESYDDSSNKYLRVGVYSPDYGQFVTVIEDITDRNKILH